LAERLGGRQPTKPAANDDHAWTILLRFHSTIPCRRLRPAAALEVHAVRQLIGTRLSAFSDDAR
jgi:hypothetical protein